MAFSHHFDQTTLREYDIRGIVGRFVGRGCVAIGRCFGTVVARNDGHTIAVGYDGRLSSPALEEALTRGLKASGMEVTPHRPWTDADAILRLHEHEERRCGDGHRQP